MTNDYDTAERVWRQTRADSHTYLFSYRLDGSGNVTQTDVTDPGGFVQRATFNSSGYMLTGNPLSVTDPLSHSVSFSYDQLDQPQTRTDALTRQDAYVFTANGLLQQHTDRKSQVTAYAYDGLHRLTGITYADSSTTALTYDAGNRVTQVVDSAYGTMTRSYTGLDQLSSETTPQGTVSYTYDAAGRRVTMTVAGQTQMGYGYDNANHLTSITQGTTVVSVAYGDAGRRTTMTYPNGVVAAYGYDAASRLTSLTFTNGGSTLGTLTYAYDAAGNRTLIGGTLGGTTLPAAVTTTVFDAANRLTTRDSTALTYDLAGNLTSDGTNTYTWNARNQLIAISGGTTVSFAYDPFGRRSTRTVGGTTTKYLYDGLNTVQELDGSLSPTANLITGLGIDQTLVRTDGAGSFSLLADALGSIVALTNGSGAIATQYTYGPFGQVTVTGAASTNTTQFTGRENDGTGLYYYRARYYSPTLGRFISEDPADFGGGDVNLYTYALNGPVNWIDPLGLTTWPTPYPGQVTAPWGQDRTPNPPHGGVDLRNPKWSDVYSSDSGTVIGVWRDPRGGNSIKVLNDDGSVSGYAHTSPYVKVGQWVEEGEPIGSSDASGNVNAHLHYTFRSCATCKPTDPMPHLGGSLDGEPGDGTNSAPRGARK